MTKICDRLRVRFLVVYPNFMRKDWNVCLVICSLHSIDTASCMFCICIYHDRWYKISIQTPLPLYFLYSLLPPLLHLLVSVLPLSVLAALQVVLSIQQRNVIQLPAMLPLLSSPALILLRNIRILIKENSHWPKKKKTYTTLPTRKSLTYKSKPRACWCLRSLPFCHNKKMWCQMVNLRAIIIICSKKMHYFVIWVLPTASLISSMYSSLLSRTERKSLNCSSKVVLLCYTCTCSCCTLQTKPTECNTV